MRGKDLLECIEQIDDALVEEAMEPAIVLCKDRKWYKNNIAVKWGMAAACVVVIGVSVTALWSHQNISEEHIPSPMALDTTGSDDTDSLSLDSLTAGAVTEDNQADADEMRGDNAIYKSPDGYYGEGSDNTAGQGAAADRGDDIVDGDPVADAASGKESAMVRELEKAMTQSEDEDIAKLNYTIISGYYGEKDGSVYDYPVPQKGKFFCYHYLQETMKYYDEQETTESSMYAYEVVIDLYGDIKNEDSSGIRYDELNRSEYSSTGSEMIEQEYRRLTELGYAVRLSEDFQLSGTFTKMELDTFQASPEYGYTFRFADEY